MAGLRITPLDIQQRQFARKKLGGLDEADVTEFLSRVARDYELVYAENRSQREQLQGLRNQLKDYLEKEKTLAQTLLSLQKTSGEVRANAEREAELVLKGAELDAERIVQEARNEVRGLTEEIRQLKKLKRKLKLDLKNVLDGYYDLLKDEGRPLAAPGEPLGGVSPLVPRAAQPAEASARPSAPELAGGPKPVKMA